MKAIAILFQVTNNIIKEGIDKEGKKLKSVVMEKRKITKELTEKFPELKEGVEKGILKMGQEINLPITNNPSALVKVTEFDIEAKFVFPNESREEAEKTEKKWAEKFNADSKANEDKADYEKQMSNYIRWMLLNEWEVRGYNGTHFVFEKQL